jgi:hypothetical protein
VPRGAGSRLATDGHRIADRSRSGIGSAGIAGLPILDWFHIAMRLQHLKQVAGGLSADDPERTAAKAAIVAEVERLHLAVMEW